MKSWLERNAIELHAEHNGGNDVIAEIFIRTIFIYVTSDLKSEKIAGTFYKKEWQKTNQKEFKVEKVIKREADKLYFK